MATILFDAFCRRCPNVQGLTLIPAKKLRASTLLVEQRQTKEERTACERPGNERSAGLSRKYNLGMKHPDLTVFKLVYPGKCGDRVARAVRLNGRGSDFRCDLSRR